MKAFFKLPLTVQIATLLIAIPLITLVVIGLFTEPRVAIPAVMVTCGLIRIIIYDVYKK
jgi:hypothetical protein